MGRFLWRAAIITHRYLGVAVGLLMLVWFFSGIVMMYVPYPSLTSQNRLRVATPLPWQACCVFDRQPQDDDPVRSVQVQTVAGEPVLKLRVEGRPQTAWNLTTGAPSLEIDSAKAHSIVLEAAPRILQRRASLVATDLIERDQWTVGGTGEGNRPLFRFLFNDPEHTTVYVSGTTGEIVLWTTGTQRFWNWLGAVPHWLYFTELRKNEPLWAQIVIWTSIVGGFLTALGLYLGIAQLKRRASGRLSPYRGWFYWHHIGGLVFGLVTLTWVWSGTLSVNPWGLLETGRGDEQVRLAGEPVAWGDIRRSLEALRANPPGSDVVKLQSAPLDGKLFWLASHQSGFTERFNSKGQPAAVTNVDLGQAAKRLAGDVSIQSQEFAQEDPYYFNFNVAERRDALPVPVYRVILNDAEQTRYYIDPDTGELLRKVDGNARSDRWLFGALHRFDFAGLRMRPAWDVIVLILMLGGLLGTASGAYLAIQRIRRDLKPIRRHSQTTEARF